MARQLRRQIAGLKEEENPLIVIGLSRNVLELGLTDDELYDYIVKDVALRLVARMHSDRIGTDRPGIKARQQRFTDAYQTIKDSRRKFDEALAEFREGRSEALSDRRNIKQQLGFTHARLEEARKRIAELEAVVPAQSAALTEVSNVLQRRVDLATGVLRRRDKIGHKTSTQRQRLYAVNDVKNATLVTVEFTPASGPFMRQRLPELKKEHAQIVKIAHHSGFFPWADYRITTPPSQMRKYSDFQVKLLERWSALEVNLRQARTDSTSSLQLLDGILHSEQMLTSVDWTDRAAFQQLGFDYLGDVPSPLPGWFESRQTMRRGEPDTADLDRQYRAIVEFLRGMFKVAVPYVKHLRIHVWRARLDSGAFQDSQGIESRIVGSLFPADLGLESFKQGSLEPSALVKEIHPFIIPGCFLATRLVSHRTYHGSAALDKQLTQLYHELDKRRENFLLRHFVLHASTG